MRLLAALFTFFVMVAQAEITNVQVEWDNRNCSEDCAKLIDKYLKDVKEISSHSVDQASGLARLQWKANTPFKFQPIEAAIRRAGPRITQVRIGVRGTASHTGKKFFVTSVGDNSKFHLLGVITPDPNRYVPTNSAFNRPLSESQQKQLLQAEEDGSIVTVEGPILDPHRFSPLDLIIQRLTISGSK